MKALLKLSIITTMALFVASCNPQSQNSSSDVTINVKTEEVTQTSIVKTINTTGTVKPAGEVELITEAQGGYKIKTNPRTGKPFKLGDKVKKDETIIELINKEYELSVRLETSKLNLEISKNEYEKQQSVYKKGGATEREMRNAEVSYINSKYDYENALIQANKLKIIAPFNGVIVALPYFTPGVKIASGTNVVSLMDYSKLILNISLPEKYLPNIEVEQEAYITNYNLKEDTLIGHINQLSPAINEETRTFEGLMTISNPHLIFHPGMFVKADIITMKKDSTIVVPREIIKRRHRGEVVYVVERGSTAAERQIIRGIETDDQVEIIKGLEPGDQLIVDGYEMLSNRSKVKVSR